jgi:D-psicose/D-tagatose/L-ribulose 3-epimerase
MTMEGFGVHTSMWTMHWDRAGAEKTIPAAAAYKMDFIEIALLNTAIVDAAHTRALLEKHGMRAVCSLGLPQANWASVNPDGAIEQLTRSLPPTVEEDDNIAKALAAAARHAKKLGIAFGIEPVNRYENHLINTGWQAKWMIEKVGADNIFIHLDTYHMNIEEKGAGNGILDARDHLRYIHLSESDRGTPGMGTCDWDEVYATLAAIGFKGGLAMESFINMPPEVGYGLAVWRPVAENFQEVMDKGLPFLRNKARQYRLI